MTDEELAELKTRATEFMDHYWPGGKHRGVVIVIRDLLAALSATQDHTTEIERELESCWRALATNLGRDRAVEAVTKAEAELAEMRATDDSETD
jgi:hypothetical protein